MNVLTSSEIRSRFLAFFKKRGHAIIQSASLVTPDDKSSTNSTLFTTAGMQPLVPYLMGKPHSSGVRLANTQKCLRTIDIDEVGDATHATFFEMLGNWSLGDYFKKNAIDWSYEFLTSKEEGLGLDPNRLYITVFNGDTNSGRDTDSADIWKGLGIPEDRIYFKDASSNWWPAVKNDKETWTGPTGPCTEMFYDITDSGLGDLSPEEFQKADDEKKVVEIWNDVFMEFEKKDGKIVGKLDQNNVDTGAGLERLATVIQKVDSIYETDLVRPLMVLIAKIENSTRNIRIITDHLRASVFLISDGVVPSNTDRGYILRRIIRRAVVNTKDKKLNKKQISEFVDKLAEIYASVYPEILNQKEKIISVINDEVVKFAEALLNGINEFDRYVVSGKISGTNAFKLFSSFGLPIDVTKELATERGLDVDIHGYEDEIRKHQVISRIGAEQKFKGGLENTDDPMIVRYHTATHLLHQALHDVLGENTGDQKGSNITKERLRFDFTGQKLSAEQRKQVEDIVNKKISDSLPVNNVILPRSEAEKTNARHFFGEKYGDQISIYFIGKDLDSAYSKEFCGGPHVKNTKELAGPEGKLRFSIKKEEAVAHGIRRIKAILS